MTILYKNNIEFKISPNEHPYLNGAWSPCREEVDAVDMEVIGEIPKDISGIYVRNTENPVRDAIGIYHPFDGDGMVHAMSFHNGQAKYSNRLVQTKGLKAEQEAGHALWTGIAGNPAKSAREGWGARGMRKQNRFKRRNQSCISRERLDVICAFPTHPNAQITNSSKNS